MPKPNALASKYLCLVQTPCAKAFLAVVREGVADKPGDWLCSDFFFSLRFWGLLGSQGEPGFYFFYRDFAAPPQKKTCIFLLRKCRFKFLCGRPDLNWHSSRH